MQTEVDKYNSRVERKLISRIKKLTPVEPNARSKRLERKCINHVKKLDVDDQTELIDVINGWLRMTNSPEDGSLEQQELIGLIISRYGWEHWNRKEK